MEAATGGRQAAHTNWRGVGWRHDLGLGGFVFLFLFLFLFFHFLFYATEAPIPKARGANTKS
jgi:hypothetical protein